MEDFMHGEFCLIERDLEKKKLVHKGATISHGDLHQATENRADLKV